MAFPRLGLCTRLGLLLLLGVAGCTQGATSLLLDITGDPKVDKLFLELSLSTGGQVSRSLPLAAPLPGRVVVELPDLAQIVTIDLTGTGDSVEYTAQKVVTTKPHQQITIELQLGQPAILDMTVRDLTGVAPDPDMAVPDLFGADLPVVVDTDMDMAVTPGPDMAAPPLDLFGVDFPPLDLPNNTLLVLAGQYGGEGSHDDVGTDARFSTLEGAVRIGNLLYTTEHYTGRMRTLDLTTQQSGTVALIRASDSQPTTLNEPAGMAYDGVAYLYIACFDHTIRKVEIATGKVSTVLGKFYNEGADDGDSTVARFEDPWGLAFDNAGFLWVADSGNKKLRKIDLSGTPTVSTPTLVDSSPTDMGGFSTFIEPHGMTKDGPYLYIADGGGVVRLDPLTNLVNVLVSKSKLDWCTAVVVVGTDLYAVDYSLNSLWRFPLAMPQNGVLVAGANTYSPDSVDGVASAAKFQNPEYLVVGANNDLFIIEYTAIRRVLLSTFAVTTHAGLGAHAGTKNSPNPLLRGPNGLLFDGLDTLYFTDYEGHKIRKYSFSMQTVSAVAGTGSPDHKDGPALTAEFYGPAGMALDNAGNLYIAEDLHHVVRKLDRATNMVSTIAGQAGTDGPPSADGTAGTANTLDAPWGLAFDGDHTLFVAEAGNSIIRTIDLASPTYNMTTLLGTGVRDVEDNPVGKLARFDGPRGLAYDQARKILYIAEDNSDVVRKADLASANHPVTTLSGVAYAAFSSSIPPGNGGPLASTRHRSPEWLALSADGNRLYVSNVDGNTIQELNIPNNVSQTIVGVPVEGFVRPGLLPARIHKPEGIAITPHGLAIVSLRENVLLLATGFAP